jgi:hypothetical protein
MILVFKTTVRNKLQVKKLKPHIDQQLPAASWNFDLQDCDKILRVVHEENVAVAVINLLKSHNYHCEELE